MTQCPLPLLAPLPGKPATAGGSLVREAPACLPVEATFARTLATASGSPHQTSGLCPLDMPVPPVDSHHPFPYLPIHPASEAQLMPRVGESLWGRRRAPGPTRTGPAPWHPLSQVTVPSASQLASGERPSALRSPAAREHPPGSSQTGTPLDHSRRWGVAPSSRPTPPHPATSPLGLEGDRVLASASATPPPLLLHPQAGLGHQTRWLGAQGAREQGGDRLAGQEGFWGMKKHCQVGQGALQ